MKTRAHFLLAVSLVASLASFARASDSAPVVAYSATQTGPGLLSESIRRGTSRNEVLAKVGSPGSRLSTDVWVYWNYRCNDATANRLGYDALILTFANDRVTDMKIVNAQTLAAALNRRSEGLLASRSLGAR
jgi:hypothetical protein